MPDDNGQAEGENLSPSGDSLHIEASLVPEEETPKVEKPKEEEPKEEATTEKPMQLTQKEYQDYKENQAKLAVMLEALSGKKPEDGKVDPVESLGAVVSDLQKKLELSEWEKTHPGAIGNEAFNKANEDRKDPNHPWNKLSYDDVWSLVSKPNSAKAEAAKRELEYSEKNPTYGSVPSFGSGQQVEDVTNNDASIRKAMKEQLGYEDSDFE